MTKPQKRSNTVDNAIKAAYAKLAKLHFEKACSQASNIIDPVEATRATDIRMETIENYLEKAGAQACRGWI